MGEIETAEAEKMGWLDLPRGTSYPTSPTVANFRLPAPTRGYNDSSLGADLYGHNRIGDLVDDFAERWRLERWRTYIILHTLTLPSGSSL